MWELGVIAITSLNMGFANLPDTAYSYDGTERDISRFYYQEIPNVQVGGLAVIDDDTWLDWNIDSGTHTRKLTTGGISLGINHNEPITDNTWITMGISTDFNHISHRPCTDSYDRQYLCTNLTAWSDVNERTINEFNNEISLRITTRW